MRLAALFCLLALPTWAATPAADDPFIWLESPAGPRAMDWVKQQNAKSLAVLQADPHYKPDFDVALALAEARDRVPIPSQLHGQIFNFWQDPDHVRGIWRRTSLQDYRAPTPH